MTREFFIFCGAFVCILSNSLFSLFCRYFLLWLQITPNSNSAVHQSVVFSRKRFAGWICGRQLANRYVATRRGAGVQVSDHSVYVWSEGVYGHTKVNFAVWFICLTYVQIRSEKISMCFYSFLASPLSAISWTLSPVGWIFLMIPICLKVVRIFWKIWKVTAARSVFLKSLLRYSKLRWTLWRAIKKR